jgi:hypothetical protein
MKAYSMVARLVVNVSIYGSSCPGMRCHSASLNSWELPAHGVQDMMRSPKIWREAQYAVVSRDLSGVLRATIVSLGVEDRRLEMAPWISHDSSDVPNLGF